MQYICKSGHNEFLYKAFLKLPKLLYDKDTNTQDYIVEKELLNNKHIISKYITFTPFVVVEKETMKPVGRCALTYYPNDDNAYFGFFECINDKKVCKILIDKITKQSKLDGKKQLVGPLDASFWIKYRLKINMFDKLPYTSEPYNKDYYYELLKDNHFTAIEHYTSNIYNVVDDIYTNEKFKQRYEDFINKGYRIESPNDDNFKQSIEDVYHLITKLYSDFPMFKNISKEDFVSIFYSYKTILNYDMVKLAYYENQLVGFFISLPNYNNKVYHLTPLNLYHIFQTKAMPKEYVMLYLGADSNHKGLGKAISNAIMEELRKSKLTSIGALARDGKVTQTYAEDLIENQYEYVLMSKPIERI